MREFDDDSRGTLRPQEWWAAKTVYDQGRTAGQLQGHHIGLVRGLCIGVVTGIVAAVGYMAAMGWRLP